MNETLFPSLHHARVTLASWRTDYNTERPHSRLGWQTPAEFARTFAAQRGLTLRNPPNWAKLCEHVQHCGNLLPACPSCGTALPRLAEGSSEVRCGCGATFPTCPECEDGWLVERSGSFGKFLGCVRYPTCTGKAKISGGDRPTIIKPRRRTRA